MEVGKLAFVEEDFDFCNLNVDQLSGPQEQQQEDLDRLHTTAQWGGRVQPGEIIN